MRNIRSSSAPSRGLLLAASAAVLMLVGCASSVPLEENKNVPVEDRSANAGAGASQSGVGTVNLDRKDTGADKLARIVYFDFDSFVVRGDATPVIETHAQRLKANGNLRIVVEGHTDDRGGREYNLALGQKRAEAVVKSLALLGAKPTQLEAVSFGMERPAVTGNDESAWAKNRRAELKDR